MRFKGRTTARYKPDHVPQYFYYKRTNQGAVKIGGKFFYLGEFGTPKSRQDYHALLYEWEAAGRSLDVMVAQRESPTTTPTPIVDASTVTDDELSIEQVIAAFYRHAEVHYRRKDGTPTGGAENFKPSLRVLRKLYGSESAAKFDAKKLKACRAAMIHANLCRNTITAGSGAV